MDDFDFIDYILRYNKLYDSDVVFYKDSFKSSDGLVRPIVMTGDAHMLEGCLGEAILENREDGVIAKCRFNETDRGRAIKDIFATTDEYGLSVYANGIQYDNLGYPVNVKKVKLANAWAVIVVPKAGLIRVIGDHVEE
jgi:hypothetical protein